MIVVVSFLAAVGFIVLIMKTMMLSRNRKKLGKEN